MIELDGNSLDLDVIERVYRGSREEISVKPEALNNVKRSRSVVEKILERGDIVYGINTGFGKLATEKISPEDITNLQRNLILSHSVGVGEPLSISESRLMLLFRINTLVKGYSGVRVELIENLLKIYNADIVPYIPEQGSVGASGDLVPLAHLALCLLEEGQVFYQGAIVSAREALRDAGIRPIRLTAKEGLALINGTQFMIAVLAGCFIQARDLCKVADVVGSLSFEAMRSSILPFDERIQNVRLHLGQRIVAANFRKLLRDSQIIPSHKDCLRVQDAYSIRCIPQVHGAVRDVLRFAKKVLIREVNSASDNPLVFPEQDEIISGGNFHGEILGFAADAMSIALCKLGNISERRVETMLNPDLNCGLPAFLSEKPGLNSGMMMLQTLSASLVSENKVYAHPASIDSIPTGANKEDHVSMGPISARKCRNILGNLETILAIELVVALQGLEFVKPLKPGIGALHAYEFVREFIQPLKEDRTLYEDIVKAKNLISSGKLIETVERYCLIE